MRCGKSRTCGSPCLLIVPCPIGQPSSALATHLALRGVHLSSQLLLGFVGVRVLALQLLRVVIITTHASGQGVERGDLNKKGKGCSIPMEMKFCVSVQEVFY